MGDTSQEKQKETKLNEIASAAQKLATEEKKLYPNAKLVIGPASVTTSAKVKAFNIINLGLDGLGATFSPVTVSGITGITEIPALVDTFKYSVEDDQNVLIGPIEVTPDIDHHVILQYIEQL